MYIIYSILCYAIGFVAGYICWRIMPSTKKGFGVLYIDANDAETDRYLFAIDDVDSLKTKKIVILNIDTSANLSQK